MDDKKLAQKISEWLTLKDECDKLMKAREDKLIPSSQRAEFRRLKSDFQGPDLLSEHKETQPGVSSTGIEARRGDERVKGVISHGYARVTDPGFHKEKAKNIAKRILGHLQNMKKPNLPKSENLDKGNGGDDAYWGMKYSGMFDPHEDGLKIQTKEENVWPETHNNFNVNSKHSSDYKPGSLRVGHHGNYTAEAVDSPRSHYHSKDQLKQVLPHLKNGHKVAVKSVGFGRVLMYHPEHAQELESLFSDKINKASHDPAKVDKEKKIKDLQNRIDQGTYKPDPSKIAEKIIDKEIKKSDHEDIVAGVKTPHELKQHKSSVPREHPHRELAAKFVTDVWRKNKHEGMRMSQRYLGQGLTHEQPLSNNPKYSTVKSETKVIPSIVSDPLKINRVDVSEPITQSGPTVINSYKNEEGTRASGEFMLVSDIIKMLKDKKLDKARVDSNLDDVSKLKTRLDRQGKNIFSNLQNAKVNPKDPVMQYDIKKEKAKKDK